MKKTYFVVTIIGPDKRGLVADVTETILENDASIEESHMMRLGGEFAMMMLIALPKGQYEKCCQNLEKFKDIDHQWLAEELFKLEIGYFVAVYIYQNLKGSIINGWQISYLKMGRNLVYLK